MWLLFAQLIPDFHPVAVCLWLVADLIPDFQLNSDIGLESVENGIKAFMDLSQDRQAEIIGYVLGGWFVFHLVWRSMFYADVALGGTGADEKKKWARENAKFDKELARMRASEEREQFAEDVRVDHDRWMDELAAEGRAARELWIEEKRGGEDEYR